MRAETRSHRNRVTDPGPNWIRSGEDLLKTDPVERVVVVGAPAEPSGTATLAPPSRAPAERRHASRVPHVPAAAPVARPNRLKLAPTLPAIVAPDSLPPIHDDDEDAFLPSCRAAVDLSYAGGSAGIRPAGGPWTDTRRRRYVPTGDILLPSPPAPESPNLLLDADDEQSTGIFEPGEAPYAKTSGATPPAPEPVAADPIRPSLTLVRSVEESVEEEFLGMRAAPLATEPRPVSDQVVDWPPPMVRPSVDYPDDWSSDDVGHTLIVIDPLHRRPSSRLRVVLLDVAAWVCGFVMMFTAGLVSSLSAVLVFFALSI